MRASLSSSVADFIDWKIPACFNKFVALTKTDLRAIRRVVKSETDPLKSDLSVVKKGIKKLNDKFTELFNFLDKEWSKLSRRVDYHDQIEDVDTKKIVNP